jgi:hypothetical protein
MSVPAFYQLDSVADWKELLADPELHWKDGRSAKSLALSWTQAQGFPDEVKSMFAQSDQLEYRGLTPAFYFPEYKVDMPHGKRASQTDLYVLAFTAEKQSVVIMVEGKVNEPFGPLVIEWLDSKNQGSQKEARITAICKLLGLEKANIMNRRYQLFHRTASAILEARRIGAERAVMMVHSFSKDDLWFEEFQTFVSLYGLEIGKNELSQPVKIGEIEISFAWVHGVQVQI